MGQNDDGMYTIELPEAIPHNRIPLFEEMAKLLANLMPGVPEGNEPVLLLIVTTTPDARSDDESTVNVQHQLGADYCNLHTLLQRQTYDL